MIGCDVRDMGPVTRDILLNRRAIAVNQDGLGRQGYRVGTVLHGREAAQVWAKPLVDGSIAVGLFNLGERQGRLVTVAWESIGLHDRRTCSVCDLWSGEDLGTFTAGFSTRVDSHDVGLVRITPQV
jgi:alpha-galactosidase